MTSNEASVDAAAPLRGRIALVTGASRGIGAAAAVRLAELGADVAVTARTLDEDPGAALPGSLRTTMERVRSHGVRCAAVVADLADPEDRARIVPAVRAELGPIDVLVNNAAAAIYAPLAEMPLRRRRLLFELNLHAPLDLIQAVVPAMVDGGLGSIVNVSSRTSEGPAGPPYREQALGTTTSVYGASKAALERLTTGLAAELYPHDVAVNSIAPVAGVWTEGAAALLGDSVDAEQFEPVATICDAIGVLAGCRARDLTGRVLYSGPFLAEWAGRAPTG